MKRDDDDGGAYSASPVIPSTSPWFSTSPLCIRTWQPEKGLRHNRLHNHLLAFMFFTNPAVFNMEEYIGIIVVQICVELVVQNGQNGH